MAQPAEKTVTLATETAHGRRLIASILRGGYCTRWHANPDLAHIRETLAEHHARVAQIILALHPAPSVALLDAALHHDAGEPMVGDLPGPFKDSWPRIAMAHADAEAVARRALGLGWTLSAMEQRWLHLADRLAAYAHVAQVRPELLRADGWPEARASLLGAALMCGVDVGQAVEALLATLDGVQ